MDLARVLRKIRAVLRGTPPAPPAPAPKPLSPAEEAMRAGRWVRAIREYRLHLETHPRDAEAYFQLGTAQLRAERPMAAMDSFLIFAKLAPRDPRGRVCKALLASERRAQVSDKTPHVWQRSHVTPARGKTMQRTIDRQAARIDAYRQILRPVTHDADATLPLGAAVTALGARDYPMALAIGSAMLDSDSHQIDGRLALIRVQGTRQLHRLVLDLAADLPEDLQLTEAFSEVCRARVAEDPDSVPGFITRWLDRADPDPAGAVAALDAALMLRDDALTARLLPVVEALADAADDTTLLGQITRRARCWLDDLAARQTGPARRLAVLSYRAPVTPSTNVGDYVQTIAATGLIAATLPDDVAATGPAGDWVRRAQAYQGPAAADRQIDVIYCDRDDQCTAPAEGETYLLVNGWFRHADGDGQFNFPFADGIRPLFLAMHIARPTMLDDRAIAYLKRYEPIGARDYFTRDLLRANGIRSFFNGCPTLTLDLVLGRQGAEGRAGRYYAAHSLPFTPLDADTRFRLHKKDHVAWNDRDTCMQEAMGYLQDYARAAAVDTPLLHCYLPCCALGTPVTFSHKAQDTDPRFRGVVGLSEDDRLALKGAMLDTLRPVIAKIAHGAPEAEIAAAWEAATAAAAAEDLPDAPQPAPYLSPSFKRPKLAARQIITPSQDDVAYDDIVLAFDANLAWQAVVTLRSIMAGASRPVRLSALIREVSPEIITRIATENPDMPFEVYDMAQVAYGNLHLLAHTTVSTMDRLLLPHLLEDRDRCAYIDVDVAVTGDVHDLVQTDLGGHPFAARLASYTGWESGFAVAGTVEVTQARTQIPAFREAFILHESLNYRTFNAGVLVLDLARLRALDFTDITLQMVKRFGINDQFAMNFFARGDFQPLDRRWNHIPGQEILPDPQLIHYTGPLKPWHTTRSRLFQHWQDHLGPDADKLEDFVT